MNIIFKDDSTITINSVDYKYKSPIELEYVEYIKEYLDEKSIEYKFNDLDAVYFTIDINKNHSLKLLLIEDSNFIIYIEYYRVNIDGRLCNAVYKVDIRVPFYISSDNNICYNISHYEDINEVIDAIDFYYTMNDLDIISEISKYDNISILEKDIKYKGSTICTLNSNNIDSIIMFDRITDIEKKSNVDISKIEDIDLFDYYILVEIYNKIFNRHYMVKYDTLLNETNEYRLLKNGSYYEAMDNLYEKVIKNIPD